MTPRSPSPAKKVKPVKAWAIVDRLGGVTETGVTRSEAWCKHWSKHNVCPVCGQWHSLYLNAVEHFKDFGYRCIRVLITPL